MSISLLTKQYSRHAFWLSLVSLAIVFMWLLRCSTLAGPGLINDSIAYIGGARSILSGTGYSQIWLASSLQPITHYPPLFSLTLVFLGIFGMDPFLGARAINILLFGLNIVLMGILGSFTFRVQWAGVLLALLFAMNTAMFRVHSYAISEPLFLFLCLICFLLLNSYLERRNLILVVCMGLVTGLAILDRYVGVALFGTLAIVIMLLENSWSARLTGLGAYVLAVIPLPLVWLVYNARRGEAMTNRGLGWHPVTGENLLLGVQNLSQWILPVGEVPFLNTLSIALLILLGILLLWGMFTQVPHLLVKGYSALKVHALLLTAAIFLFVYLLLVLFSITVFDPATKLQDRILVPVYLCMLFLFIALGHHLWQSKKTSSRLNVIIISTLMIGSWVQNLYQTIGLMQQDGQGYASRRIQESPVIRFIENMPDDISIYTDSPTAIYSATQRPSFAVPMELENGSSQPYYAEINQQVREGSAILVLFETVRYTDPVSEANYHYLTAGTELVVKFGSQRAFLGGD